MRWEIISERCSAVIAARSWRQREHCQPPLEPAVGLELLEVALAVVSSRRDGVISVGGRGGSGPPTC